jgi:hypothetical protein
MFFYWPSNQLIVPVVPVAQTTPLFFRITYDKANKANKTKEISVVIVIV